MLMNYFLQRVKQRAHRFNSLHYIIPLRYHTMNKCTLCTTRMSLSNRSESKYFIWPYLNLRKHSSVNNCVPITAPRRCWPWHVTWTLVSCFAESKNCGLINNKVCFGSIRIVTIESAQRENLLPPLQKLCQLSSSSSITCKPSLRYTWLMVTKWVNQWSNRAYIAMASGSPWVVPSEDAAYLHQ